MNTTITRTFKKLLFLGICALPLTASASDLTRASGLSEAALWLQADLIHIARNATLVQPVNYGLASSANSLARRVGRLKEAADRGSAPDSLMGLFNEVEREILGISDQLYRSSDPRFVSSNTVLMDSLAQIRNIFIPTTVVFSMVRTAPYTSDHFYTVRGTDTILGYRNEGAVFRLLAAQVPGSIPLYQCTTFLPKGFLHLLATDCSAVNNVASPVQMGYIYPLQTWNPDNTLSRPPVGYTQLYRCTVGETDILTTIYREQCEGKLFFTTLGWVPL